MDANLQVEQQAILDFLWSKSEAEANCHHLQEAEAEQPTEVDDMLPYMHEEEEPEPSYAPICSAPRTNVVDISDDEA